MALQQSTTFRGVALPNAYHRIVHVANSRTRGDSVILVDVFADATAATGEPLETITVVTAYQPALSVGGAYLHLKTLPEFAGAAGV